MSKLILNDGENRAEILFYDVIGPDFYGEGLTAKSVKEALNKVGAKKRVLARINSPGGSVFEASAMYNLLKDHPAGVDVSIDGACFSAASFLAMVGENVSMAANAMMMIHDPWTIALGNAAEMRKTADMLDQVRDLIVDTYAARTTKLSREELVKMMADETWLKPQSCLEHGLIDEVSENKKVENRYDLSQFQARWKNFPQDWPQQPQTPRLEAAKARAWLQPAA